MVLQSTIFQLISDKLLADGYFLVSVEVGPSNAIIVLIDSDKGVTIDYCANISRLIENSLDREQEDFSLEVSSPGIGQPFKVLRQYQKCIGKEIEVLTKDKVKVVGILLDVEGSRFRVSEEKLTKLDGKKKKVVQVVEHQFNYDDIVSTKEVIRF